MGGWVDGRKLKTTWSANSELVPFPSLPLYNMDWIPLLCPLLCYRVIFPSVSHRDTLWSSASSFLLLHLHSHSLHARPSHSVCISGSSDGSSAGTHDLFSHVASILHYHHFCFTSLCCIRRKHGMQEKAAQRHVCTYHVFSKRACMSPFPLYLHIILRNILANEHMLCILIICCSYYAGIHEQHIRTNTEEPPI